MLNITTIDVALAGFILSSLIWGWNVISSIKEDAKNSVTETNRITAKLEMLEYRVELLEQSNPRCIKGKDSS
jgi:hypothetical protein